MVEACARLQVGISEYAKTIQRLVSVYEADGVFAFGTHVAVIAENGRRFVTEASHIGVGIGLRVVFVVVADEDERNRKSEFDGKTLGNARAYVPVAVQDVAEVIDEGLDIAFEAIV